MYVDYEIVLSGKKTEIIPILKKPTLRRVGSAGDSGGRDKVQRSPRKSHARSHEKVQIRMSLVEEQQLTPITVGTAYKKPSIYKRKKLLAAAHEFSKLMDFNRIEVESE
ncbi:hypothetical protein BIW11_06828, partial [Tropilaelaps mercedesae]